MNGMHPNSLASNSVEVVFHGFINHSLISIRQLLLNSYFKDTLNLREQMTQNILSPSFKKNFPFLPGLIKKATRLLANLFPNRNSGN